MENPIRMMCTRTFPGQRAGLPAFPASSRRYDVQLLRIRPATQSADQFPGNVESSVAGFKGDRGQLLLNANTNFESGFHVFSWRTVSVAGCPCLSSARPIIVPTSDPPSKTGVAASRPAIATNLEFLDESILDVE